VLRHRPGRPGTDRPRIVFLLANAYGIGGTTRTCLNLASALAAEHEVQIISVLRTRDTPLLPQPAGVTVVPVEGRPGVRGEGALRGLLRRLPSALFLPTDRNLLRRVSLYTDIAMARTLWQAGDAVFIGTRPALNNFLPGLGRTGSVTVAQEHMNIGVHPPRALEQILRIYRSVDAAVMLTEGDRAAFHAAAGPRANLFVIPNGVPAAARRSPLTSRTIVSVGRLTQQKGLDRLLTAFAEVAATHPDWRLRICGAGPMRASLERQVGDLGLGDRVTFAGQVRRVQAELLEASIFALTSRFEGLPMALIEAMAGGLAVVAFDCPTGPREVIEHGRSGLLVPEGDTASFAQALVALIEDEPHRRALAQGALLRSHSFSIESIAARWTDLLGELARASPGAGDRRPPAGEP
jgi:glycosyltransferase involved in cell wall biosynthesis